jgi:hypothetical protein
MFFDKVSIREIARIMGFKSENYVKSRKFKCKELLVERIKQDKDYKKIFDDDT